METSILKSVKKALGLDDTYTAFDPEIVMHINSVLATLNQVGVGPEDGFQIEDTTATWDDLLRGDLRLSSVKTYVYAKVRLIFDPPATSFAIDALTSVTKELEYRIYTVQEVDKWV